MTLYPRILEIAKRHQLDLNMLPESSSGLLADWSEIKCGSDLHSRIEQDLDDAGVDHDWVWIGERGYWEVQAEPATS